MEMLLIYGIIFYLLSGPINSASACIGGRKKDDGKIRNFNDAMWRFQTDFLEHVGKPDKSKFAYSPHSAALSLLAVAFGGEIRCRLADVLHLNMSELRLPLSSSGKFGSDLREFVRLGHAGGRGKQILSIKYTNHANKNCKIRDYYKDALTQLGIDAFTPKGGLSSKHSVKSVIVDTVKVKISDFAEKCMIRKSSKRLDFHAENVREGTLESLNGAKFYSIPSTNPDVAKDDKVRLVLVLPAKRLRLKDLKKLFSKMKYKEFLRGSKKSLTFSMRKPSKINKQYDLKRYLSQRNVNMSRKHADTIANKFDDICSLKDDFSMHGYHLKQSANFEFDSKDLVKAPRCSKAKRKINVKIPKGVIVFVLAKKTILLAAAT